MNIVSYKIGNVEDNLLDVSEHVDVKENLIKIYSKKYFDANVKNKKYLYFCEDGRTFIAIKSGSYLKNKGLEIKEGSIKEIINLKKTKKPKKQHLTEGLTVFVCYEKNEASILCYKKRLVKIISIEVSTNSEKEAFFISSVKNIQELINLSEKFESFDEEKNEEPQPDKAVDANLKIIIKSNSDIYIFDSMDEANTAYQRLSIFKGTDQIYSSTEKGVEILLKNRLEINPDMNFIMDCKSDVVKAPCKISSSFTFKKITINNNVYETSIIDCFRGAVSKSINSIGDGNCNKSIHRVGQEENIELIIKKVTNYIIKIISDLDKLTLDIKDRINESRFESELSLDSKRYYLTRRNDPVNERGLRIEPNDIFRFYKEKKGSFNLLIKGRFYNSQNPITEKILIRAEPFNPHDVNAHMILNEYRQKIGYVSKDIVSLPFYRAILKEHIKDVTYVENLEVKVTMDAHSILMLWEEENE